MKTEEIFFPFTPVAKGRPKFSKYGHTYTPKKTADYEKYIAEHYKEVGPGMFEGPVYIKLIFQMPIPKSYPKWKLKAIQKGIFKYDKKPDLDNLAKSVLDALNGIAYEDDSNITQLTLVKRYSQFPGVKMTIREDVD